MTLQDEFNECTNLATNLAMKSLVTSQSWISKGFLIPMARTDVRINMSGDIQMQEFDVWHEQIPMFSMPCLVHDLVPGAPLSARGTSSDRGPASKMQTLPSGLEELNRFWWWVLYMVLSSKFRVGSCCLYNIMVMVVVVMVMMMIRRDCRSWLQVPWRPPRIVGRSGNPVRCKNWVGSADVLFPSNSYVYIKEHHGTS